MPTFPDPTTLSRRELARASEGLSHPDCWGLDFELEREAYREALAENNLDEAFAFQQGRDIAVDRADEVRLAERPVRKQGKVVCTSPVKASDEPEQAPIEVHDEQASMLDSM